MNVKWWWRILCEIVDDGRLRACSNGSFSWRSNRVNWAREWSSMYIYIYIYSERTNPRYHKENLIYNTANLRADIERDLPHSWISSASASLSVFIHPHVYLFIFSIYIGDTISFLNLYFFIVLSIFFLPILFCTQFIFIFILLIWFFIYFIPHFHPILKFQILFHLFVIFQNEKIQETLSTYFYLFLCVKTDAKESSNKQKKKKEWKLEK